MMNWIYIFLSLFLLAACSSAPTSPSNSRVTRAPFIYPQSRQASEGEEIRVDQVGLQRALGLERPLEDLGYQERAFNTCQVGYGYSSVHDCQVQHFVVIHFRLQCRDSEGTISEVLTDADVTPLGRRQVRWTLPGQQGEALTDSEGYGQIRAIFSASQKGSRLKLASNGEFLYIRAGEIKRIVTPQSWCP